MSIDRNVIIFHWVLRPFVNANANNSYGLKPPCIVRAPGDSCAMRRWSIAKPALGLQALIGAMLGLAVASSTRAGQASADNSSDPTKPLWSLAPLVQPPVPPGAAHPIDAFVRARLAEKRLKPSPLASRRELLRRLSYDLTGLPP